MLAALALALAPAIFPSIAAGALPAREGFDVEAACASIAPADVAADLAFLCDPALGGRPTPSDEIEWAAAFLAAEAQRAGLAPARSHGYLAPYPLERRRFVPGEGTWARFARPSAPAGGTLLLPGRDYVWTQSSELARTGLAAELAVVGALEPSADLPAAVAGRWALVFDEPGRSLRRSAQRAAEAGAAGVLAVRAPDAQLEDGGRAGVAERHAALTASLLAGIWRPAGEPAPDAQRSADAPAAERKAIPVLALKDGGRAALAELVPDLFESEPGRVLELVFEERRELAVEARAAPNVAALWPGRGPRAREVILLSAHFDHVGLQGGELHPGADDNASGASALLCIARALSAGGQLERSVLCLWVSGEEQGLWGSRAFARDAMLPAGLQVVANVNLDMVGRTDPAALYLTPSPAHDAFNAVAETALAQAGLAGFGPLQSQDDYWTRSDHYSFHAELGVPVLYLSSGDHEDYHQPSDVPERVDLDKVRRVACLVVRIAAALEELEAAELGARSAAPAGSGR